MIRIYNGKTTEFTTNGVIMNEWTELTVVEALNGEYTISGRYPITDSMKYMELLKGSILLAPTPNGYQPFRIFTVDKNLQDVSIEGFHVFYDLAGNNVPSGFYVRGNGDTAIKKMLEFCENEHPFTGSSDVKEVHSFTLTDDTNPLQVLFKDKHCFTYMWSAEVLRDGFHVALKDRIGEDTNVQIRYGKNLLSFNNNSTWDNVITKINVTYKKTIKDVNNEDIVVTLTASVVSDLVNDYPVVYQKNMEMEDTDNSFGFNTEEDLAQYIRSYYFDENNVDKPKFSVSVDWIKEHDYQELKLGDTAVIIHEEYAFEYRLKITKYTFNCLTQDYDELFFGDLDGQIETLVTDTSTSLDGINTAISNHTTNIFELNKRLNDLENPIYYPNAVYNSNFGRFNEFGKPDFWETTGIVTPLEHLTGTHSLRLEAGQYLRMKDKPILTYKWASYSTLFNFRAIGTGTLKVSVLADGKALETFSYYANNYLAKKEHTFTVDKENWFDSKLSVELHPSDKVVHLSIECTSGVVYVDAVSAVPAPQGSKLEIQYQDGPLCTNDVMQLRNDDLLDAQIGDMWFLKTI